MFGIDAIGPTMQSASLIQDYDMPVNAMIVGASAGIGLALSHQLATRDQVARLFVVARTATRNPALAELVAQSHGRIVAVDCDIRDEIALARMTAAVAGSISALHLVINTAGMLHENTTAGNLRPEKSLAQVTLAGLQASFAINAFGPILLAKALLPLLRHKSSAVFASLSARVGSIGDNRAGGWYSYRAAKAAQNQLLKTLAIELTRLNPQAIVLALHPGTTDTGLSKPFQANVSTEKLFSATYSAEALLQVISARVPADSGNFYAWDGQPIDW